MLFHSPSIANAPDSIVLGEAMHTSSHSVRYVSITPTTETGPVSIFAPLAVLLRQLESGYVLVRPINANIQRLAKNNFVASFAEANINASGQSFHEAASNLQSIIVDMFELLSRQAHLGPEPKSQLRLLRSIIRKTA